MWYMTVKTIFTNRWMFPEEWTTFFLVTAIAGFVNCSFDKHSPAGSTMNIVAGRTIKLTFLNRVMRCSHHLYFYIGVTVGAEIRLILPG
jgi:hypothetical protein